MVCELEVDLVLVDVTDCDCETEGVCEPVAVQLFVSVLLPVSDRVCTRLPVCVRVPEISQVAVSVTLCVELLDPENDRLFDRLQVTLGVDVWEVLLLKVSDGVLVCEEVAVAEGPDGDRVYVFVDETDRLSVCVPLSVEL
eukprot:TRINITY_DN12930_c0_g1_i1.p2 TRINITY_DN12930_c0_g1~~TRINITY_DN12930_c0_g1_i1.p2  ORF type:complete len:140 (-),score=26.72 TRINITY_DN12930_c0_g1_i1:1007-1426(-)